MGNVRRLHADPQSPVHGDLGGYSYTAFGKTIAVSDPGGVRPPLDIANQPFQWQGKRLLAAGLYDSRARVWSTDLGAFLQPDEYVYLSRAGTLWSWPGQNPFRWRDPSGRDAGGAATAILDAFGSLGAAAEAGGAADALGPVAAAAAAGAALAVYATEVKDLAREIYEQQDANANAIAKAAESAARKCEKDARAKEPPELPLLDATGKVHGRLPEVEDFDRYAPEDLEKLSEELQQSVQERIQKTNDLGSDKAHGERQAQEQQLIRQIEKYLQDHL